MVTAIETHCNLHLSLEWNLHGDEIEMSCPSSTQQTSDKKGKNIYETVQPKKRLSLRRFTVIIQQRWGVKRNALPTFSNAIQVAMIINKTTISTDTECNFMSTVVGIRCIGVRSSLMWYSLMYAHEKPSIMGAVFQDHLVCWMINRSTIHQLFCTHLIVVASAGHGSFWQKKFRSSVHSYIMFFSSWNGCYAFW